MTLLLIGHDANRAGAQLVLLQLMRLLRGRGITLHLLLGAGGPLLDDYRQTADLVVIWPAPEPQIAGVLGDKVLGKLGLYQTLASRRDAQHQADMRQQLRLEAVDLILVNTVTGGRWFDRLNVPEQLPVVTFVHEQEMAVAMYTQADELARLLNRSDHVLAVSRATASYYQTRHGVDPARMSIFTLIDLPAVQQRLTQARAMPDPMPELGIPAGAIVVGGCGNAEWRKGNDLFINLARLVKSRLPHEVVHFVWVGMPPGSLRDDLSLDIDKAGLTDRVHLVAPTPDVLRYLSRFAIFALCSREDPYPLVVIEAGLAGIPVVCFDRAGGAGELVEADGGFVVPYLDLGAMSDRIAELATDPTLRRTLGQRLTQKINDRHDPNQSLSIFLNLLTELTHT
ncbi:MAG: glycosyltransferase family 4 protein [Bacteroidetes bacterium]|nr:glycosyltransferase family 4 protein [Fibrella sp.]